MRMAFRTMALILFLGGFLQSQDATDARQDGQIQAAMALAQSNSSALSRLNDSVANLGREMSEMNGWVKGFGSGLGVLMLIQTTLQIMSYRKKQ